MEVKGYMLKTILVTFLLALLPVMAAESTKPVKAAPASTIVIDKAIVAKVQDNLRTQREIAKDAENIALKDQINKTQSEQVRGQLTDLVKQIYESAGVTAETHDLDSANWLLIPKKATPAAPSATK